MQFIIREMKAQEYPLLDEFLYQAIFVPKGVEPPARDIINDPALQVYVQDFGQQAGDDCLVAEVGEKIVGAVWVRIMNDYGHIDDDTPSFAISLLPQYRGNGIGTSLMRSMLQRLASKGVEQVSLAVQKDNYAVRMYRICGFEVIGENEQEFIMLCRLTDKIGGK